MPKVSVIIPFYNRLEWTHEAVQSVLTQTFQDFELILVDDGSLEMFTQKYPLEDKRIKYLRQKNLGRSAARNLGFRASCGEYITFLDSDDLYLPEKLEKQTQFLESSPSAGMIYCDYQVMNENGEVIETNSPRFDLKGFIYPELLFFQGTSITTPSVMIRRELISQIGGFDEEMHICEDLDLWRRIAKKTKVIQIKEPLIKIRYRSIPDSLWISLKARKYYYKKAIEEDSTLKSGMQKMLYSEMYFKYGIWGLKQKNICFFVHVYLNLIKVDAFAALIFFPHIVYKVFLKIWLFSRKCLFFPRFGRS